MAPPHIDTVAAEWEARLPTDRGFQAVNDDHGVFAIVAAGCDSAASLLLAELEAAALRDGRQALARHYIAERTTHEPGSAWGMRPADCVTERRAGTSI